MFPGTSGHHRRPGREVSELIDDLYIESRRKSRGNSNDSDIINALGFVCSWWTEGETETPGTGVRLYRHLDDSYITLQGQPEKVLLLPARLECI